MARLAVIVSVITLSLVLVGCNSKNSSKAEKVTAPAPVAASNADSAYAECVRFEQKANLLKVIPNDTLKKAIAKYDDFIVKYPTSPKIGDAAFRVGMLYETLQDYDNAVKYYQRAYQWDPQTPTSARFKAAYVLDTKLGRRDEALKIYQEALSKVSSSNEHRQWVVYAEQRVKELSGQVKPQQ
jgi:tetratricopeptide (TPR) repeat protein